MVNKLTHKIKKHYIYFLKSLHMHSSAYVTIIHKLVIEKMGYGQENMFMFPLMNICC